MSPTCCRARRLPLPPGSVRSAHPQVVFSWRRPKGGREGTWVQTRRSEEATLGRWKAARGLRRRVAPAVGQLRVPFGVKADSATNFLGNKPGLLFPLPDHVSSLFFLPSSLFSLECPGALALGSKVRPSPGQGGRGHILVQALAKYVSCPGYHSGLDAHCQVKREQTLNSELPPPVLSSL